MLGGQGAPAIGDGDNYPGDAYSAIFGGGNGVGYGHWWPWKFQVQPANPLQILTEGGQCKLFLASTPHTSIQVALADGSVRSISGNISDATWAAALTPAGGEVMGDDWDR